MNRRLVWRRGEAGEARSKMLRMREGKSSVTMMVYRRGVAIRWNIFLISLSLASESNLR